MLCIKTENFIYASELGVEITKAVSRIFECQSYLFSGTVRN